MNRRTLFTPTRQAPALPRRDLVLKEAPLKSAFEMVFKGFEQSNYFLDNAVSGLVTVTLQGQTFERTMGVICQLVPQLLEWKREEGIVSVRAARVKPEASEDVMATFQRARLPMIEGVPCRVAGCLLGGKAPLALLETGNPLSSEVQMVQQGERVKAVGARYLVERISEEGIVLKSDSKTLRIPLLPLVPK